MGTVHVLLFQKGTGLRVELLSSVSSVLSYHVKPSHDAAGMSLPDDASTSTVSQIDFHCL